MTTLRKLASDALVKAGWAPSRRRHGLVGPGRLWKEKRAFQIGFLKGQGPLPTNTLLDLGCGTLRGGIPIIDYLERGNHTGFDVRPKVIIEARRELAKQRLQSKDPVLLTAPSFAELHLPAVFDVIWAFSVLIHFEDEVLDQSLMFVSQHLDGSGRFFANVNIGDRAQGEWAEFPVVWRSMEFYEAKAHTHGLALKDLGELQSLGHELGAGDRQHMLLLERL